MNPNHLETTDLFKGAFLLCMGGCLARLRVEGGGRKTATFLITGDDLERHNADYMTGKALVNPMQLKNSLNHLRDQLFNTLRENENRRTRKDHAPCPESPTKTSSGLKKTYPL